MIKFLQEDDLQVGDIIFFMGYGQIPAHLAIYSGKKEDTHFITHGVSDPYYSMMTTRLKTEHYPYRVFRSKDFNLAAQTAYRMRVWSQHQVLFSKEKHDFRLNICETNGFDHPKTGGEALCKVAEKYFAPNFYRYIEYAAHPDMPFSPSSKLGMTCSEAIVAAFNMQYLISINAINTPDQWVTDNMPLDYINSYITQLPKHKKPSQRYINYLQSSHSIDEYPFGKLPSNLCLDEPHFSPAIAAWNYTKYGKIEFFLDKHAFPLPLDAKITLPWGLMTYFLKHPEHWLDVGTLIVQPKQYAQEKIEANKEAWRHYVQILFDTAQEKQQSVNNYLAQPQNTIHPSSPCKLKKFFATMEEQTSDFSFDMLAEEETAKKVLTFSTPPKKIPLKTLTEKRNGFSASPTQRKLFSDDEGDMDMDVEVKSNFFPK